jgi:hydroxymethylbilane synthase
MARRIAAALDCKVDLVTVRTTGDRIQNQSLAKIGGKGLFIKEIEESLLSGEADLAVHSAKDLPARIADGCRLAAFPERADPRDALVTRDPALRFESLGEGARIGTGSVRRTSQLLALRPDLEVVPIRGNVDTRLQKLEDEGLDAVVLACAGLDRLGRGAVITERLAPEILLPAIAQGTLALETREGDELGDELAVLNAADAVSTIEAERAFLAALEGDCSVPLAAFAECLAEGRLRVRGLIAATDGTKIVRGERLVATEEAASGGRALADQLLAAGGDEILASLARPA